jgi:hypothetical protein
LKPKTNKETLIILSILHLRIGMLTRAAFLLTSLPVFSVHALKFSPEPLALWTFQEPTGRPRLSVGMHEYSLEDGNNSYPVERGIGGLFGPFSANFTAAAPNQRLRAERATVPALTVDLGGVSARVSLVAWVRRPVQQSNNRSSFYGFVAGVWGDTSMEARQYALYFDLGACNGDAPTYAHGAAAHISNVGGPTPGHKWSVTAACDPRPLPPDMWHCVANVYDGETIRVYVNATLSDNGNVNPYPLTGGIYSPEAAGRAGAEFGVGVTPAFGFNQFEGLLGGLAVFNSALTPVQLGAVCEWPSQGSQRDTTGNAIIFT